MRFRELERLIVDDGWILYDVKDSHHQYRHPFKKGKVAIPKHGGDIPLRVAYSVLKQAGLKWFLIKKEGTLCAISIRQCFTEKMTDVILSSSQT